VLAFVLMGLQARPIIERLSPEQRWGSLVFGLTVLALVIVVRIIYLAVYRATVAAIKCWHPSLADRLVSRDPRGTIVISWSGMRGLVTLATAFALPPQFPGRDLIMLCAFCVVLGTLVIQGLIGSNREAESTDAPESCTWSSVGNPGRPLVDRSPHVLLLRAPNPESV
jgi:CPA1 family monovalent cation:H+ antiporter